MTLAAGSKLGPYEIVEQIGAGGMGEVYRAKDPRLGREVAIKVLPAFFDPDRLRRFEREAQAAGGLNHPNITAVHDIGTQEGAPYVVMELLRGETLRERLASGPIAVRKAIDYGIQIARGLAAAHSASIIHRDLKPENLFVTNDGRVKILDFGLAKLTQTDRESLLSQGDTVTQTEPGVVLGTLGYMSPEQVKGMPADARSDIFSLGAVLYEMLAGKRAFRGDSAAETMSAILKEEPPELTETNKAVAPGLERVVRRCLEKNPEERTHSAHDLAFQLETMSTTSGPTAGVTTRAKVLPRWPWLLAAAAAASALAALLLARKPADATPPSFLQLTYRRGPILSARFAPDGQTIFYTAAWDGKPMEIFVGSIRSAEARPFGLAGAEVLAVSRSGEIAASLNRSAASDIRTGTLARVSMNGGIAPREVLERVIWADWAPDGKTFAVVREVGGKARLEFPVGKTLHETNGYLADLRISPDGKFLAFIDHPVQGEDGGMIMVLSLAGKREWQSDPFSSAAGLAWAPSGDLWFTAMEFGGGTGNAFDRALYSSNRRGKARLRVRIPGSLTLLDISNEGRLLVSKDIRDVRVMGRAPGDSKERDLTWLSWSVASAISPDGRTFLFTGPTGALIPSGDKGIGPDYSVYFRKTDGSLPVRLGDGISQGLSHDGKWALAILQHQSEPQLAAYPTGPGEPRLYPRNGLTISHTAGFLPDDKSFVFVASEQGRGPRLFIQPFEGDKPRALTPEGYHGAMERAAEGVGAVSPDGKWVLATDPEGARLLYPLSEGQPVRIAGLAPDDILIGWGPDTSTLFVRKGLGLPAHVVRHDLRTSREEKWRDVIPEEPSGVTRIRTKPSPSGEAYVYCLGRMLSDLYLVENIR